MSQKYYDFKHIYGNEMETLLVQLKKLINSGKITEFLPDNVKDEISKINDKINADIDIEIIDGGEYEGKQNVNLPGNSENNWEW